MFDGDFADTCDENVCSSVLAGLPCQACTDMGSEDGHRHERIFMIFLFSKFTIRVCLSRYF